MIDDLVNAHGRHFLTFLEAASIMPRQRTPLMIMLTAA